jgi:serine/threonine protein kinase
MTAFDPMQTLWRRLARLWRPDEPGEVKVRTGEKRATSLRSLFDDGDRLTPDQALNLMRSLLGALGKIHADEIVHRNLHPGCVLVDEAGRVTLTGFELAVGPGMLGTGAGGEMSGGWVTMSPEQIQGEGCDARSDIFQVGVIFYQLLTGKPPFAAPGAWSRAKQILNEDPAPPSSIDVAIPAWLDGVSLRALAKERTQRYGSAGEFAAALASAASDDKR